MKRNRSEWMVKGGILGALVVFLVALLVMGVCGAVGSFQKEEAPAVESPFSDYRYAKSLAVESYKVVNSRTEEEYKSLGTSLKSRWSGALWDEYFAAVNYQGGVKSGSTTITNVGIEKETDGTLVVKIEGEYVDSLSVTPLVILYTIRGGVLVDIESLA